MRMGAIMGAAWIVAAAACGLAASPAAAQAVDATVPPVNPTDANGAQAGTPLTPEEAATLANALTFDPTKLTDVKPAKPLRLPGLANSDKFDVSHTSKSDGSSTLVMKRPLASEWDAKVGADLNLAPPAPDGYQPSRPLPAIADNQNSGAAWASVGVPNLANVDARVDPGNDQGKLGTTFKHSIPFGERFSVTLQDSYSVTQIRRHTRGGAVRRAVDGRAGRNGCSADAASLGQPKGGQIRRAEHRHDLRRRRDHRQQRSDHAQHLQRRSETLRPAARDHGGHRFRAADRQQKHLRRLQAELVSRAADAAVVQRPDAALPAPHDRPSSMRQSAWTGGVSAADARLDRGEA